MWAVTKSLGSDLASFMTSIANVLVRCFSSSGVITVRLGQGLGQAGSLTETPVSV